jgi:hypothetical protein
VTCVMTCLEAAVPYLCAPAGLLFRQTPPNCQYCRRRRRCCCCITGKRANTGDHAALLCAPAVAPVTGTSTLEQVKAIPAVKVSAN